MKKSVSKSNKPGASLPPLDHQAYQDEVKRRAYELWEAAGRPQGHDLVHWLVAEREVAARSLDQGESGSAR